MCSCTAKQADLIKSNASIDTNRLMILNNTAIQLHLNPQPVWTPIICFNIHIALVLEKGDI
jgi:hypothetical protein